MPSLRTLLLSQIGLSLWLAGEQQAFGGLLLAQSGAAKTATGWVLVCLALFFALLFIGLPSWRKRPEGDARPVQQKKRELPALRYAFTCSFSHFR